MTFALEQYSLLLLKVSLIEIMTARDLISIIIISIIIGRAYKYGLVMG